MKFVRSYPGIGAIPELRHSKCELCGQVETIEAK
jgi:hypothetical protein